MAKGDRRGFWWPLVMAVVLMAGGVVVYRGIDRLTEVQRELEQVISTNRELQKRNQALHRRITRLRGDKRALEKEARLEMDLIRKNEVIYREPTAPGPARPAKGSAKP